MLERVTEQESLVGFVITEFLKLPPLPDQYRHQSGHVEVLRYLVAERTTVEPGTSVLLVENWWATFEVVCEVRAVVAKNLLDSLHGVQVQEGSELAFLILEPDCLPPDGKFSSLKHLSDKRIKPRSTRESA
jgi:hypothetical protein